MKIETLSAYLSGGVFGAFAGLWVTEKIMTPRRTTDGIAVDVDLFGWTQFSTEGLWVTYGAITVFAIAGALVGRGLRRVMRGK